MSYISLNLILVQPFIHPIHKLWSPFTRTFYFILLIFAYPYLLTSLHFYCGNNKFNFIDSNGNLHYIHIVVWCQQHIAIKLQLLQITGTHSQTSEDVFNPFPLETTLWQSHPSFNPLSTDWRSFLRRTKFWGSIQGFLHNDGLKS